VLCISVKDLKEILGNNLAQILETALGNKGLRRLGRGVIRVIHQNRKILTLKKLREREIYIYTYDISGTPGYFSTTSFFGHDV
jgi:hypothetical protein